jgi:PAS domain S-box-containing protein
VTWSRRAQLLVFVLVVLMAAILAAHLDRLERTRTYDAFESHTEDIHHALIDRLDGYVRTLDGAAALFAASSLVTAQEWEIYVNTLDIETRLPEILGVGYIALVDEQVGYDPLEHTLENGLVIPPVHPVTGQDERYVVQFIEPLDANKAALGLDISFDEARRVAADLARESNTVQLTPLIELVQGNSRADGYLLLRPLFAPQSDASIQDSPNSDFLGWIYMSSIGETLFSSLTKQHDGVAYLSVYDGVGPLGDMIPSYSTLHDAPFDPQFEVARKIAVFGREWTMVWKSTPRFESANPAFSKWIVLSSGITVALLLTYIMQIVSEREARIERDVARKTCLLRAKSEEAQSVIDNAVISIFVLDPFDRIISANDAAKKLFGVENVSIGDLIGNIISFQSDPVLPNAAAQPGRVPDRPEIRLMVERNYWVTADDQARTTLLVQNVSESKESARRLEANETRWNLALDGAHIGVFDIDLRTNVSIVSDSWRKLMGIPADAVDADAQKLFSSRVHPDDLMALKAADRACIDGLTHRSTVEYRIRFEDGSVRWMKSDAVVVERDHDGVALRLLGAQTDVTELRNALDALRESRERFELVIEHAPVGMALFNKDGEFRGKNQALCEMTGYSDEELGGKKKFRDLVSNKDLFGLLQEIDELKCDNQSSVQGEYKIIRKSGPPIWGLLSVAWTFDPVENEDIFIVQIFDISEKKNAEKMKSEFVATVSHELRTPLTSIKGALGLLRVTKVESMPRGTERLLEIAAANTDRLAALVDDILDLEKIRSGDVEFFIEPNCLAQLLRDGVEQMLPFAAQHNVELVLEVHQKRVCALIDASRVQQVIVNLLSNACKYSDDDTKIHVRLEEVSGQALVCILNSGPTISDEFRSRIFQPFSQADSSDTRSKGGTGLGLNIARQIVERMDGKIGFTSKANSPTAFWFTLPLAEVSNLVEHQEQPAVLSGRSFNFLHLDDDSDFLEILRRGLGSNAMMTSVRTPQEARLSMKENVFDVIVFDRDLSVIHGRDILDDIAELQPTARVIGLSDNESRIWDIRFDLEMTRARKNLNDIILLMEKISISA